MIATPDGLAGRIRATLDYDAAADVDHVLTVVADQVQTFAGIAADAVSALLASHADTGTDLTTWPDVLALVTAVCPSIVIEGTGHADRHVVTSPEGYGETGRYWLDGDTSTPCNADAAALRPSPFGGGRFGLGRTR